MAGSFIRLRIPGAMIRYFARIRSPRSVRMIQCDDSSSHSLVSTPVWNSASSTNPYLVANASRCRRISSPNAYRVLGM